MKYVYVRRVSMTGKVFTSNLEGEDAMSFVHGEKEGRRLDLISLHSQLLITLELSLSAFTM